MIKMCKKITHLVHRYIWLPSLHGPECETALLQLGLGIVPFLIGDELIEPGEEADLGEDLAVLQVLVNIEGANERLK